MEKDMTVSGDYSLLQMMTFRPLRKVEKKSKLEKALAATTEKGVIAEKAKKTKDKPYSYTK